jgi:5-methylcytosine-specific restriction protein A
MGRLTSLGPRLTPLDTRRVKPPPKTVEPFYTLPEYRVWRAEVIRRAQGRCQWPGCGRAERRMYADHIIERKDGGADLDPANGQCLCHKHHGLKTAAARNRRLSS